MAVLSIVMPFSNKRELQLALDVLVTIDLMEIPFYRLPPLYETGVRYRRELYRSAAVPGVSERFLSARQVFAERLGDCEDLAAYLCAQRQLEGVKARAMPIRSSVGWHIIVRHADGTIEDPSKVLGM